MPAQATETKLHSSALLHIRAGVNPFASQVAAVGTADESLLGGVPEFAENQLGELREIVASYRTGKPATSAFVVMGSRGVGKTHLFYTLRNELKQQANECGEETLLVAVDRLSPGMDATDYLLWQIVNHFLAHKGEGGRLLEVIAGRLTARLLGESLRQLAPHQKAELIPNATFLSKLGFGSTKTQNKIDAIDRVIQQCEGKQPTVAQLRSAVETAGVKPAAALKVVEEHLSRTESNDVFGWLRKELYGRLARFALLKDREPFDDLHTGGFEDAQAHVKNAGNLGRRLLETWLELLAILKIPVVVVFDQLEDYITAADPDQEKINRKFFTEATTRFINELRGVCVLIFANETFWFQLLNSADAFARERLTQPFTLPGRGSRTHIDMPDNVSPELVIKLVQRRLKQHFPNLDLTGLPPSFPFDIADVQRFAAEQRIRACLRAMAKRYDEIVFAPQQPQPKVPSDPTPLPPPSLRKRLAALWAEQLAASKQRFETGEISVGTAFIPEVQNALDGWLQFLFQHQVTGSGPWHRVELVTDTKLGAYGYLSVVRTDGRNAPGVGIAAWLGQSRGQAHDLKQRATFFKANPCPIRTLGVLRADKEATLKGPQTKEVYDAVTAKHDVRVREYQPQDLYSLLAFAPWQKAAVEEVNSAKATDPNAETAFRDYLAELSRDLLEWIDDWRKPREAAKGGKL